MNKVFSSILIAIVLAIAIGTYYIANTYSAAHKSAVKIASTNNSFDANTATPILVDSFVHLIASAYHPFATCTKSGNDLQISITNANQIARDFFNGNEALLKLSKNEVGFEIKYNAETKSTAATFNISNGLVTVPNDVLIKAMDKVYNGGKK